MGIEDEYLALSAVPLVTAPNTSFERCGMAVVQSVYVQRVREMLRKCFRNLVAIDMDRDPDIQDNGRLWNPGVIELFRLLTEQVTIAATVKSKETTVSVAHAALDVIQR